MESGARVPEGYAPETAPASWLSPNYLLPKIASSLAPPKRKVPCPNLNIAPDR